MEVSKLSFTQHTRDLLNARPLSRTAKGKLRKQRIIEYIRELPFGECQKADLITAGGWDISNQPQYSSGWTFLKGLEKKKVIKMSDGTNPKNFNVKKWEVVADIKTIKPRSTFQEILDKPMFPDVPKLEPVIMPEKEVPSGDLLEQAKNFAWNTNSDSLREFVAWIKQ